MEIIAGIILEFVFSIVIIFGCYAIYTIGDIFLNSKHRSWKRSKSNPSSDNHTQTPPPIRKINTSDNSQKICQKNHKRDSDVKIEKSKRQNSKRILISVIVILSVLLASVSGFAVYQQKQIQKISDKLEWKTKNYESSIDTLTKEKDIYKTNWYDAYNELMLYQYNVGIMTNNSMYYHVASCEIIKNAMKDDAVNCFMLTVNAAKSKGYRPCPDCRSAESRTN